MKIMQEEINNILYKEKGGLLNDILGISWEKEMKYYALNFWERVFIRFDIVM